jgi:N-acetylmuramoyl-L-alanine amidase
MRSRRPAILVAAVLALGGTPIAAPAQLRPSPQPQALPAIPLVDGPLAITVVYPPPDGPPLGATDSTFLFGSVGSGLAILAIDGTPVEVASDGAFLAWLPLPDDTVAVFHLQARKGSERATLDARVRLPARFVAPERGLWLDPLSMEPRGEMWVEGGEQIRVSARAAPGAAVEVVLPDGRAFPLVEDSGRTVAYGPFERRPERLAARVAARFTGTVPAVPLGRPLPGLVSPGVTADTLGASAVAVLVASLGSDTVRTVLPLRVSLVDPLALPVVVLDDDTARTGTTRGAVSGAPSPHGTYHWFFRNGTRAAVDGRIGDQLRLRLSRESAAWVSLAAVAAVLPAGTPAPRTRVRLVRLAPQDSSVVARLALDARVPYRVDETDRALTMRLYGAVSDLDFVQYGGTDPLVRRVTWAQPAEDECTVTFELSARVFGWRTRWDGNDAVLEIRRPPRIDRDRPLAGRTIAVDPGHPPQGATGPTGLQEADANLAVAQTLRELLEGQGARVVMTRTSDTLLGLYERTAIAEQANAELLVSIHNNAFPDGVNPFVNNGTTVYYFHPRAARLAQLTEEALVGEMGLRNLGAARGNFALVRESWMPAILVEGVFLMIPEQENALRTPGFQEAYARGVALGIEAFLRELAASPP